MKNKVNILIFDNLFIIYIEKMDMGPRWSS